MIICIIIVIVVGFIFLAYGAMLLVGFLIVGKLLSALFEYWSEEVPRLEEHYSYTPTPLHYGFERYGNPIRRPPPAAAESVVTEDSEAERQARARLAEKRLEEERRAALRQRVDDAVVAFEHRAHYADDSFIRNYARVHKDELLAANSAIVSDRIAQHRDTAFIEALKKSSPATYERMQFPDKAAAWAEQLDVQPPPPPPRNRPKKPTTPTAEKQRAERGRRVVMKGEELLANAELGAEMKAKARELRDRCGLDNDDYEALVSNFDELLRRELELDKEDDNGKSI